MTPAARGLLAGITAAVIVGGSVPVTGLLDAYPLLTGQSLRYALGGVLLLGYAWLRGIRLPRPMLKDLPILVALGVTGMVGFQACLLLAQRYAEPGLVAALLGGSPLVLALVAPVLDRRRPAMAPMVGAVLAAAGIVVLAGGGASHGPGLALAVLAMLCEASFTLLAAVLVKRMGPLGTAACSCLTAALGSAVLGTFVGGWRVPDARELAALLVLAVIVTAVAFCLWYFAVAQLGADRAGLLIGLMPASGLVVAISLGAQQFRPAQVLGVVLVALGVVSGLAGSNRPNHSRPQLPPRAIRSTSSASSS
ncbi:DMT family transporter [Amycolatopsis sp. cg5]|uniref:DMT family transporter n=1 Tax=Amycolatopsis sp. cg5 TaxID=3238802 RepID=UPI0035264BEF